MLCTTAHIVCVHNACVCSFTWTKYKGNMHHTHKDVHNVTWFLIGLRFTEMPVYPYEGG